VANEHEVEPCYNLKYKANCNSIVGFRRSEMSASLKLFVLYFHLSSVYLDHLVPLEAVNHGKEGRKEGYIFHKGGMSFIGIIGMNSRYEAEIQILTSPVTNHSMMFT
jgi:hypothetical protein